jgi:hypothetical protein
MPSIETFTVYILLPFVNVKYNDFIVSPFLIYVKEKTVKKRVDGRFDEKFTLWYHLGAWCG